MGNFLAPLEKRLPLAFCLCDKFDSSPETGKDQQAKCNEEGYGANPRSGESPFIFHEIVDKADPKRNAKLLSQFFHTPQSF